MDNKHFKSIPTSQHWLSSARGDSSDNVTPLVPSSPHTPDPSQLRQGCAGTLTGERAGNVPEHSLLLWRDSAIMLTHSLALSLHAVREEHQTFLGLILKH